jgi:hypothetical protein
MAQPDKKYVKIDEDVDIDAIVATLPGGALPAVTRRPRSFVALTPTLRLSSRWAGESAVRNPFAPDSPHSSKARRVPAAR